MDALEKISRLHVEKVERVSMYYDSPENPDFYMKHVCRECGNPWPCATIKIVNAEPDTRFSPPEALTTKTIVTGHTRALAAAGFREVSPDYPPTPMQGVSVLQEVWRDGQKMSMRRWFNSNPDKAD